MIRKHFCAAPWSSLSMDPDGLSKLCPISQDRTEIKSFSDAKSNAKFIEIRQAFIDDQQHTNCNACWDREQHSSSDTLDSRRSVYQYNDFYSNLEDAESFSLQHLDLRWSNTCNLNCVYCSPVYSSKWAKLLNVKEPFRIMPKVTIDDIKSLTYLQLAGGEPLLIKENLSILEQCLESNPSVEIEVTTNLMLINQSEVYSLLKKFPNVRFVVSFESIGDRFEYIRNGSKWTEFQNNIKQLAQDFKQIDFNMVYFPLSAKGISDAIRIAQEYTTEEHIFIVSQFGGHGFDMVKSSALQYLRDLNLDYAQTLPDILKNRLVDQVNLMSSTRQDTHLPNYNFFDTLTNQNHKTIFTELY